MRRELPVLCGEKPNTVMKSTIDGVECCKDFQPKTQ